MDYQKFETVHLLPGLTAFLIALFGRAETSQTLSLGLNTYCDSCKHRVYIRLSEVSEGGPNSGVGSTFLYLLSIVYYHTQVFVIKS